MKVYSFSKHYHNFEVRGLYSFDSELKRIHLFDTEESSLSIQSAIELIRPELMNLINPDDNVETWRWIIYGRDHVFHFNDVTSKLEVCNIDDPDLLKEFLEVFIRKIDSKKKGKRRFRRTGIVALILIICSVFFILFK